MSVIRALLCKEKRTSLIFNQTINFQRPQSTIDFIDVQNGNEGYLDKVCKEINKDLVFDWNRTAAQLDSCKDSNQTFYMYPSICNDMPINMPGKGCVNTCNGKNYDGFYCKRKKEN